MRTVQLLRRNLTHYWRTNLPVVLGVAAAVAVLAGALLVGDSVRASLKDIFLQRLGRTDFVITGNAFFREQLASDVESNPRFRAGGFGAASPLIELAGTVSVNNGARAGSVKVYGVDERFWKFNHREGKAAPQNREVFLSDGLAQELGSHPGDSVLVQIEKPSTVPRESLYGRKDDLGRTLRLTVKDVTAPADLGEFSTRPQQGSVRAVFISLQLLQKELEQSGQVNTILVSRATADVQDSSSAATALKALQSILKESATLSDYSIKLRPLEQVHGLSLERPSTLVDEQLAATSITTAKQLSLRSTPIFSYVANAISFESKSIPYSLVTAVDEEMFQRLMRSDTGGRNNQAPAPANSATPIILNEWAAKDLGASHGAEISLKYYYWHADGRLETRAARFYLAAIVPMSGPAADRDLVPDYPGISESESIADWDPPFPVDLGRLRKQDEDYWKQYRTTPKAFIPLAQGQALWQSRFGKLTSIRITPGEGVPLAQTLQVYGAELLGSITPDSVGLSVVPVRSLGLTAARGATDFGEYFLYFSFFLVVSALMLTALFFKLLIEQRLGEIGILQALGFPRSRIRTLFLWEGLLLAIAGSLIGLLGALAYGQLMMFGLRTWWVNAVGTTMLSLHVSIRSLALGGLGGVIAALVCVYWTLRSLRRTSTRALLVGTQGWRPGKHSRPSSTARLVSAIVFTAVGVTLLLGASFHRLNETAGFFGSGTTILVALLCYESAWLRRTKGKSITSSVLRLGFRNATYRPTRSVLCIALIASASFIIVAIEAFRRDPSTIGRERKSGSGGFPLMAESLLPLVHDPNSRAGREALSLSNDQNAALLAGVNFSRFRLRPGDDTSCLNLYQPGSPRVLGATEDFIHSNRFVFQNSLARNREEMDNNWLLLNRDTGDGVVPVIADANSLTYVLHLNLGDEFVLDRSEGPVRLRVVAVLSDSIFQGELIMAEPNFLRLFPHEQGYRFFLIDALAAEQAAVSVALEDRLADLGFDVIPTEERLASFHRVENTYLSTFQMLGGLGLLLGTLGMAAVLLRNVLERRRELALLRAVGYNSWHFAAMVLAENAVLLCSGLVIGTLSAAIAIAPIFMARGGQLPNASLGVLLLAVLVSGFIATVGATWIALRSPLLPALRAE